MLEKWAGFAFTLVRGMRSAVACGREEKKTHDYQWLIHIGISVPLYLQFFFLPERMKWSRVCLRSIIICYTPVKVS